MASVFDGTTTRSLTYDGRGNIASELRGTTSVTTGYDAYGRLTSYATAGGSSFTMKYSGSDERVEVQIGTATPRRFVYDESGRLIGEYGTGASDVKAEHVWMMPDVVEGGYEPLALVGTVTTWVHGDHLGTPVLLTTAAGAQANRYEMQTFGARSYTATTTPTTAMALPGQVIDAADRFYNRYRDYDPSLGRYLQADPIGLAGGDNVYAYVDGNPINAIDPMGLEGERGATGGAGGQNTNNPYKHCRDHPTDPTKIICRHHQTGKWIPKPKPADWPGNKRDCPENNQTARNVATAAAGVGAGYIIWRVIRFLPSLAPPLWETIPVNLAVP